MFIIIYHLFCGCFEHEKMCTTIIIVISLQLQEILHLDKKKFQFI